MFSYADASEINPTETDLIIQMSLSRKYQRLIYSFFFWCYTKCHSVFESALLKLKCLLWRLDTSSSNGIRWMGLRCHLVTVAESAKSNCTLHLLTQRRGNGQDWCPWQPQTGEGARVGKRTRTLIRPAATKHWHARAQRCANSHHNP